MKTQLNTKSISSANNVVIRKKEENLVKDYTSGKRSVHVLYKWRGEGNLAQALHIKRRRWLGVNEG